MAGIRRSVSTRPTSCSDPTKAISLLDDRHRGGGLPPGRRAGAAILRSVHACAYRGGRGRDAVKLARQTPASRGRRSRGLMAGMDRLHMIAVAVAKRDIFLLQLTI